MNAANGGPKEGPAQRLPSIASGAAGLTGLLSLCAAAIVIAALYFGRELLDSLGAGGFIRLCSGAGGAGGNVGFIWAGDFPWSSRWSPDLRSFLLSVC